VSRLAVALALTLAALPAALEAAGWERAYTGDDLVIDTRSVPASAVKELRAEGLLPAPPHVVRAVLADLERYPEFMPYVKVARVLERETDGAVVAYLRLSFGALGLLGVTDRDYAIRIDERVTRSADGRTGYWREWNLADVPLPSSEDGSVVRVPVNRGYWELRPAPADVGQTLGVYCLFIDPGGSLPAWAINRGNTQGVPKVYDAVRAAVREPRYAGATSAPPAADASASGATAGSPCADR